VQNPAGLIIVAVGVFSAMGGIFDWDWFMNNRKAKLFVTLLTRNGARVAYVLLGAGVIAAGLLTTLGIIKP
jgi:Immunity protein 17